MVPEFLELSSIFFSTGIVLEKSTFAGYFWSCSFLELNSEFLTFNFLDYNICSCSLFESLICNKMFQFCPGQPQ